MRKGRIVRQSGFNSFPTSQKRLERKRARHVEQPRPFKPVVEQIANANQDSRKDCTSGR